MTRPSRPSSTRISLSTGLTRLIVAIFLIPAPFEILTAILKREQYDVVRLSIVMGALILLALMLSIMRNRNVRVQAIVGYYLIVAGLFGAALGIALTLWPPTEVDIWPERVVTTISALMPAFGLLLIASGVYVIYDQARRAREELDTPARVGDARPQRVRTQEDADAWLWTSDLYHKRPAAAGMANLCMRYLNVVDLHFVAVYTVDGDCLFHVDVLDDERMAHFDVHDTQARRSAYEHHGRHLRFLAAKVDKRFGNLDSGVLVRMVMDVEKGALYYYNLKREGFLVGVTLEQAEVDPTDRKLSELANEILIYRGGRPDDDFYRK